MTIPTVNLSMIPTFPARVVGSGPVTIMKAGLVYTFGWDISVYSINPAPDSSQVLVLGYNGATGATERYPLSAIQSGLQITASQISDATANGRTIITGSQSAGRTALGLGDVATLNAGTGLTPDSGTLRLATSGASAGSYTNASVTVDIYGRVTAASTGSAAGGALGQCRLVKSGSNIVLQPFNGNALTINGTNQVVPNAGVSLAPTGLTPSTLYYVYAYMSGGTMTLEASTTGHSTDTSTGLEIKTGDATRTLVGMAYPVTGPAFADTSAQRLVISWFNRQSIYGTGRFSAIRTSTATSYAEINSEIRIQFLSWASPAIQIGATGGTYNSGSNQTLTSIGVDSTSTAQDVVSFGSGVNAQSMGLYHSVTVSEGFHYATILGRVSAGTGNWYTNTDNAGERFTLKVVTYG